MVRERAIVRRVDHMKAVLGEIRGALDDPKALEELRELELSATAGRREDQVDVEATIEEALRLLRKHRRFKPRQLSLGKDFLPHS